MDAREWAAAVDDQTMTTAPAYLHEAAATLETLARCRAETAEDKRALLARAAQYREEAGRMEKGGDAKMIPSEPPYRIEDGPHRLKVTVEPYMCTRPGTV